MEPWELPSLYSVLNFCITEIQKLKISESPLNPNKPRNDPENDPAEVASFGDDEGEDTAGEKRETECGYEGGVFLEGGIFADDPQNGGEAPAHDGHDVPAKS